MSEGNNIDERIQFLLKSQESLTEDIRELYCTTAEHSKQMAAQEVAIRRLRRALFAAVQGYLDGEDEPQS